MNRALRRFLFSKRFFSLFLFFLILSTTLIVQAEVPQLLNYQGRLTDENGVPKNGDISIKFRIYNAVEGGGSLWGETQTVTVKNGVFNVLLGSGSAIVDETNTPKPELREIFDGAKRWLAIQVENDPEMVPRQEIVSAAYSMRAEYSEKSGDGVPPGAVIMFTGTECPNGYSRLSELDGRFVRGADTGLGYGAVGGTQTHRHTVSGNTNNSKSHNHNFNKLTSLFTNQLDDDAGSGFQQPQYGTGAKKNHQHQITGPTTQGGIHLHSLSISTNVENNIPPYTTVLFCLKD